MHLAFFFKAVLKWKTYALVIIDRDFDNMPVWEFL